VVDEKPAADLGAGVDFYAGEKAADLRNQLRKQGNARMEKPVSKPVSQERMQTWRAQYDFDRTFRGRVVPENGVDLFPNGLEHFDSIIT
jgi:phosphatidylserine/phosphatidylglycerophosphate/cardiolipin synthase-like enzyme